MTSENAGDGKTLRIVVVGDSAVGKSALLTRYTEDTFSEKYVSTIGMDFRMRSLRHRGPTDRFTWFTAKVWDTSGSDRFHTITESYLRKMDSVILTFSLTDHASFSHLGDWFEMARTQSRHDDTVVYVVVGNKADAGDRREVSATEIDAFMERLRAHNLHLRVTYIEASAKENVRIAEIFEYIASEVTALTTRQIVLPMSPIRIEEPVADTWCPCPGLRLCVIQ